MHTYTYIHACMYIQHVMAFPNIYKITADQPLREGEYSRTSIIRTPMCHFNVKSVQISEFVRISELSDKYTISLVNYIQ